jgi:predicted dinucleotide-binding enzyme
MTIGVLGAGRMGLTLARLLGEAGHTVLLANSRAPHTLAAQVAGLQPYAVAVPREELPRRSDIVVLATPWDRTPAAVAGLGPWDGKVVVDTTNNRFGPKPEQVYDLGDRGSSEVIAELLPAARVVKAFNHQPFAALALELGAAPTARNALFVAGDDGDAKERVAQIIRDMGGEPIDTGGLRDGGRLQSTGGPLAGHGRLLTPAEARELLGVQVCHGGES